MGHYEPAAPSARVQRSPNFSIPCRLRRWAVTRSNTLQTCSRPKGFCVILTKRAAPSYAGCLLPMARISSNIVCDSAAEVSALSNELSPGRCSHPSSHEASPCTKRLSSVGKFRPTAANLQERSCQKHPPAILHRLGTETAETLTSFCTEFSIGMSFCT